MAKASRTARKSVTKTELAAATVSDATTPKSTTKPTPKYSAKKSKTEAGAQQPTPTTSVPPGGQPHELSSPDRAKIKKFLDANPKPFAIKTTAPNLKRKAGKEPLVQTDLWEDRLSVGYEITPANTWECLRRYKKFTVGSESIAIGQTILVKHDDDPDSQGAAKAEPDDETTKIDVQSQWKARVLEVRALDSEHVYIRVAWLNRPEDLDEGRKSYHGKYELIPSNHMDIIDAMSVNGSLEVMEWDDGDEDAVMPEQEQYYWRQTYDSRTKTLSKLQALCTCNQPQNPDSLILQCSAALCRKWLHVRCIAEDAVTRALESNATDVRKLTNGKGKKGGAKKFMKKQSARPSKAAINHVSDPLSIAEAREGGLMAEVLLNGVLPPGMVAGEDAELPEVNEVVITHEDGEKERGAVRCLFCGVEVEDD